MNITCTCSHVATCSTAFDMQASSLQGLLRSDSEMSLLDSCNPYSDVPNSSRPTTSNSQYKPSNLTVSESRWLICCLIGE